MASSCRVPMIFVLGAEPSCNLCKMAVVKILSYTEGEYTISVNQYMKKVKITGEMTLDNRAKASKKFLCGHMVFLGHGPYDCDFNDVHSRDLSRYSKGLSMTNSPLEFMNLTLKVTRYCIRCRVHIAQIVDSMKGHTMFQSIQNRKW